MRLLYPETEKNYLRVVYKSESTGTKSKQATQAKIIELQEPLKKQQETVDKGTKLMQVLYVEGFQTDFLF